MLNTLPRRMELDHDKNQSLLSIILYDEIACIVNYTPGERNLLKGRRLGLQAFIRPKLGRQAIKVRTFIPRQIKS